MQLIRLEYFASILLAISSDLNFDLYSRQKTCICCGLWVKHGEKMINPPLFRLVDMSRRSIIANRNLTNHLWGRTFKNGGLPSKVVQKLRQQTAMISNDAESFSSALWSVSSNKIFLPENDRR